MTTKRAKNAVLNAAGKYTRGNRRGRSHTKSESTAGVSTVFQTARIPDRGALTQRG